MYNSNMDLLVVCADPVSGESELLLYFGGRGAAAQAADGAGSAEDTQNQMLHILGARPLVVGSAMGQVLRTLLLNLLRTLQVLRTILLGLLRTLLILLCIEVNGHLLNQYSNLNPKPLNPKP